MHTNSKKAASMLLACLGAAATTATTAAQAQTPAPLLEPAPPPLPPSLPHSMPQPQPQPIPQLPPEDSHGFTSGAPSGMRAEAGADLEMRSAATGLPQPQTRGAVTWLCGGISRPEADYMQRRAADYDLKLTFAGADGAYLADVNVEIRTRQGELVLQTACDGPIMLVDVPKDGSYRIAAEAEGRQQTRSVRVNKARAQSATLVWPDAAAVGGQRPSSGAGVPAQRAQGVR